jgi:pentatricopeptide repeat protein
MHEMKERWLGLSPDGWHSLVVGLLRDRQIEMAIDKLEQMQGDAVPVQPWLYDIVMYKLCEVGELDQAYQLLIHRFQYDRKRISQAIWYFLLDTFSCAFHVGSNIHRVCKVVLTVLKYDGTNYIWKLRVIHNYLNPSDGICANVLNLAARYGDGSLATSATRILSSRRTALTPLHYEALLASYTGAGDINTALRVLGIMSTAGFEPDSGTTRPLFDHLTNADGDPHSAWEVLKVHFEEGRIIHVAAINVIIEAYIARGDFEQAMEVYKDLHTICEIGPNIETINLLLQGAERRKVKETAIFVASEMVALGIKPDQLTYDRLIMICLHEEDYEDAFNYLEEMVDVGKNRYEDTGRKGWWMRKGTAVAMVQKCARSNFDPRGKAILEQAVQKGVIEDGYASQLYKDHYGGVRPYTGTH